MMKPICNEPGIHILIQREENWPGEELAVKKAGDSGVDLYAAEPVKLLPGHRAIIPCGFRMQMPEPSYHRCIEAQVRPTSGNAAKRGLTVLNTPGTIDNGYRGTVGVIGFNANPVVSSELMVELIEIMGIEWERGWTDRGREAGLLAEKYKRHLRENTIHIGVGDKIAQLVFTEVLKPHFEYVEALSETERGADGYGSTGIVGNPPTEK